MEFVEKYRLGIFLVLIAFWLFFVIKHYNKVRNKPKKTITTRFIVRVAVFGAISAILYTVPFLKFSVPIFPTFLEFHFDEIPIFIAGFAYGPWAALAIIFVRTIIKMPMTSTLCVGEFADLVFSIAFIIPAAIIYKYKRTLIGAIVSIIIGMFIQFIVAILGNVYVMVPFYMQLFGLDEAGILAFFPPAITDIKWSYAFLGVLPFNLIKNTAVIIVTMLTYKPLRRVIDRAK